MSGIIPRSKIVAFGRRGPEQESNEAEEHNQRVVSSRHLRRFQRHLAPPGRVSNPPSMASGACAATSLATLLVSIASACSSAFSSSCSLCVTATAAIHAHGSKAPGHQPISGDVAEPVYQHGSDGPYCEPEANTKGMATEARATYLRMMRADSGLRPTDETLKHVASSVTSSRWPPRTNPTTAATASVAMGCSLIDLSSADFIVARDFLHPFGRALSHSFGDLFADLFELILASFAKTFRPTSVCALSHGGVPHSLPGHNATPRLLFIRLALHLLRRPCARRASQVVSRHAPS